MDSGNTNQPNNNNFQNAGMQGNYQNNGQPGGNYQNNVQPGVNYQNNYQGVNQQGRQGNGNYQNNYGGNPQPNGYQTPQNYGSNIPNNIETAPVMTLKDWLFTTFLLALPIAGFILAIVWAFDSSGNPNRRNFCRATLIWMAVGIVLTLLLFSAIMSFAVSMVRNFSYSSYY